MQSDIRGRLKEWLATGQARLEPLAFPQRELWETSPVPPDDPSNNICCYIDIRGPLTSAMCREALSLVVARHDALRTSFLPGKERPLQCIRAQADPMFSYRELTADEAREENLVEAMAGCFGRPMDLLRGPLYRLEMLRRGPDHNVFAIAIHHAVADGWTMTNFVVDFITGFIMAWRRAGNDMSRVDGVRDSLPPLAMTYSQWAAAERARWQPAELERHASYWRARLDGARTFFSGSDAAPDRAWGPVEKWTTSLPAAVTEPVRKLARQSGVTMFSALLAAFRVALFLWSKADDVVVGSPMANRSKSAIRESMGYFSGIVPLRGRLDPAQPLSDTLRLVHAESMEDFAHAMPFAELVSALGDAGRRGRHPVFDVRFAVQNHPLPSIDIPGITSHFRSVSSGTSRFDMACEITDYERSLDLTWLRRSSLVTDAGIADLDRLFRAVLGEMVLAPQSRPIAMHI